MADRSDSPEKCEEACGNRSQLSVVYEIEQGPGSKPKYGRPPFPWWCDLFGPYEVQRKSNEQGGSAAEQTDADSLIRGVGPFTLVSVFDHGGGRFMSQCLYGARAAFIKQLPKPCLVRMEHNRDGVVLSRQGVHNHQPEVEAPIPLSGQRPSSIPAGIEPPTFEQMLASLQPFRRQCKRQFKTYISVVDPDTQQIVQMPITTENLRKVFGSAQPIRIDGKLRWCCPVDDCGSQMLGKWNLHRHLQLYHLPQGQRLVPDQVKATPKQSGQSIVCPICKENFKWRRKCLQHIIDDHRTPIDYSEHEFISADDFWEWKARTETVEMSTFLRHQQSKLHEIEGIYQCSLGRRAAYERKCEGETKPRKKARLLNHFCPAVMDVKVVRGTSATENKIATISTIGRIHVTFYRTHIGHTPSPLDVKMTTEDAQWLREQLEAGRDPQDIMSDVAKTFDGRGSLRRLHVLDLGDIARTAFRYGLRKPEVRRSYEWWRTADFSRDLNLARRRLVEVIRAKLDREEPPVVKKTEKHQWAESLIKQVIESNGVCHVREEDEVHVVYPRKSDHDYCEDACTSCNVCVHRYGCTCVSHVIDGQMCQHVHAVALRKGPPGSEFITSKSRDTEEAFNPAREIRALGRINYNQRVQEILTIHVPRLVQLLQNDHFVDLDRVVELIGNAVDVLEKSGPIPNVHREENVPKPLSLDEFCGHVGNVRLVAAEEKDITELAEHDGVANKQIQTDPSDIDKTYKNLADEEDPEYFKMLLNSVKRRKPGRPPTTLKQKSGVGPRIAEMSKKTGRPRKKDALQRTSQKRSAVRALRPDIGQKRTAAVILPIRRSHRIHERKTSATGGNGKVSNPRRKGMSQNNSTAKNEFIRKELSQAANAYEDNACKESVEINEETNDELAREAVPEIVVMPYEEGYNAIQQLGCRRRGAVSDEGQTVHEFVITPAAKRTPTTDVPFEGSVPLREHPPVDIVIMDAPSVDSCGSSNRARSTLREPSPSRNLSAMEGWIHDHVYT